MGSPQFMTKKPGCNSWEMRVYSKVEAGSEVRSWRGLIAGWAASHVTCLQMSKTGIHELKNKWSLKKEGREEERKG